jgi:hypothetical protein
MRTAIRVGSIEIDTIKRHGNKWISASIQHLEVSDTDDTIISESARADRVYRRVDKVALETVDITDPVTGQAITISVAGIGEAVKAAMIKWMLEDNTAHYDPDDDLVIIDD